MQIWGRVCVEKGSIETVISPNLIAVLDQNVIFRVSTSDFADSLRAYQEMYQGIITQLDSRSQHIF